MPKLLQNWRPARVLKLTAAGGAVGAVAILAWALFWPDGDCSQPACARRRFAIAVMIGDTTEDIRKRQQLIQNVAAAVADAAGPPRGPVAVAN